MRAAKKPSETSSTTIPHSGEALGWRRAVIWRTFRLAAAAIVLAAPLPLLGTGPTGAPPPAGSAAEVPAAPDLVRIVRGKLAAADVDSAEAWTEDWRRDYGVDATYWAARSWLARGAWMLGQNERALGFAREVQAGVPASDTTQLVALGAALEVEGQILAASSSPSAAVRFFHEAATRSDNTAFRSRMWKNINRLELVGSLAPGVAVDLSIGDAAAKLAPVRGGPVLLFFWAHWCGDCHASIPTLTRIAERFGPRGLTIVAPTRLYGTGKDGKAANPTEELAHLKDVVATTYGSLSGLPVPVDTETMVRYGASATPTFVLIDKEGIVRLYAPTRLTESALAAAIEPLLPPVASE